MFNTTKTNQLIKENHILEQENTRLLSRIKNLEESIEEKDKRFSRTTEENAYEYHQTLEREKNSVELKVAKATKELNEKLSKTTEERNSLKKENEILTKAFENLGFDVKDMKDILNKLVDGIVSKNTINVVK